MVIMIILIIIELVGIIIGWYLASKYDCDNYLVPEREQLIGAIGMFFLVMGSILLPLTVMITLTFYY